MKNKIICLLLVLVMCLGFVVSCGNDKDNNDENNTNNNGENTNTGNQNGGNNGGNNNDDDDDDDEEEYAWWDEITYDETTLRYQMTECTNGQELPSGCKRYLSGAEDKRQDVDAYVRERNKAALENTRIKEIIYNYYPDNVESYGYSKTISLMANAVSNPSSETPDIFCNWMTDLLCTSLLGSLANLKGREYGKGDQYGVNFFDLNDDGYMAELMGSLTLDHSKIYVIASDYYLDLIRAFFVVPVNLKLYNTIAKDSIEDLNEDGKKDINDFFVEVTNGGWTYEKLIEYSNKIYQDTNSATKGKDAKDTLGFALGYNGLPAAGLVYTSSVVVINKEADSENPGKFKYSYSDENDSLYDLAKAIKELMSSKGIMCFEKKAAEALEVTGGDERYLLAVRKQFVADKLLFGGIILVGSLEYEEYQSMKGEDTGFGVVPVPVYKAGDKYLTQIHVVGRAGGIAHSTHKFAQCTAYLHYQSSHSARVKNEYYDINLAYDLVDNLDGNVEMLEYIRNNVRTSFDKLFEDAIAFFNAEKDDEAVGSRWHDIIKEAEYEVGDMRKEYMQRVGQKNAYLEDLITQYGSLE